MVLYLKQNISLAVYESIDYLTNDMMSSCGYSNFEIACEHDGANSIALSSEVIQKMDYREIQLTEISKEGKPQKLRSRVRNTHSFGEIHFDTLSPGDYKIKGDVHMLFGHSRFKIEPFEYAFKVE